MMRHGGESRVLVLPGALHGLSEAYLCQTDKFINLSLLDMPDSKIPFSPLSKTRRQLIARLASTKLRRKEGMFIVEGYKNVADLMSRRESPFEPVWLVATWDYLTSHAVDDNILRMFAPDRISGVTAQEMKSLSMLSAPSDLLAVFTIPEKVHDPLATPLGEGLFLLLDGVRDPGNLGTIVRTAHWFGVRHIFASHDTVDLFNPKVVQSTMGSLGAVEVDYVNLPSLVAANPSLPLVGLQLEGDDLFRADLPSSAMICMGSEGNGLSEEMRRALTRSLTIPPGNPADHPESLNVAIATAVTLSRFVSCRYNR